MNRWNGTRRGADAHAANRQAESPSPRGFRLLAALALCLLPGCQPTGETTDSGIVYFAQGDADLSELAQARQQAQENLEQFIQALRNPQPGQRGFAVKKRFSERKEASDQQPKAEQEQDGPPAEGGASQDSTLNAGSGNAEYMWVAVTEYENGIFRGTLDNTPQVLSEQYERGQPVEVPADEVEDWVYLDQGRREGGWSIEYLLQRANQQQQESQADTPPTEAAPPADSTPPADNAPPADGAPPADNAPPSSEAPAPGAE